MAEFETVQPDDPKGPREFERLMIERCAEAVKLGFRLAKQGFSEDQAVRYALTGEDTRFTERAEFPARLAIFVSDKV